MLAAAAACLLLGVLSAHAVLPRWLQHVVGASTAEAALYRLMSLPAAQVLYPRPPKEAQAELQRVVAAKPADADLYALRARADESALDFPAAETDWKLYAAHAADSVSGKLELANYYHRRLQTAPEIATLREVAAAPSLPAERFTDPATQRSWIALQRTLSVIADQALPAAETQATYEVFIARYPGQSAVYARFFQFLLDQQQYPAAEALIARFHAAFPQDAVFPIRAQALLEYRRGSPDQALAVYDRAFQPLWPADLVGSYFALLQQAHRERAFVADARARLAAHPDGPEALNALARIFYYQQQQGHLDRAQQTLDAFRIAREQRNGSWSAADLATLAALSGSIHSYAEQARYDYALASSPGALPGGEPAAQAALAGLVDLLLSAPDQPIALGAGNLTLYRDIATLDQGPGYWNGILSLWLNGTSPETEYNAETAEAQSYFHRAKAAELLAQLDQRFAAAPQRPALHLALMRAYADYGEPAEGIAEGKRFLTAFASAPQRIDAVNLMADAYARQRDTAGEFALYDSTLAALAAKLKSVTGGMPLSAAGAVPASGRLPAVTPSSLLRVTPGDSEEAIPADKSQAFSLAGYTPAVATNPDAAAYAALLDRYVARLVAEKQLPQALVVLRRQLDLSPDDPQLYERLASFLEQNNLSNQQETVYKTASARFGGTDWYDKLSRLYLRERNREAYAALTRQVTDIFSGSELDAWFSEVGTLPGMNAPNNKALGPRLALQLNLYAQKRFPHDLVFTHNLLNAYSNSPTKDAAAYEALLRRAWWLDDGLRSQFFGLLSSSGRLQAELDQLQPLAGAGDDPAAGRELAEADVWTSHFEQAAPLMGSLAGLYPADPDLGDRAVSLFRSLSYLDPTPASLNQAVAIEKNLYSATPVDADRLATLGDLYAEATSAGGEDLPAAAPYWRRIPMLEPGSPAGYLTSATIFWDYFQFADAQQQIQAARQRFHQPALFGYESGAIAENRGDLPAAVNEYGVAATQPLELSLEFSKFVAVAQAWFKPPSDAADSNLRATAQSFFGSDAARARLLRLAVRPATQALVNDATAHLLGQHPTQPTVLTLRAEVLVAQHREKDLPALFTASLSKATTVEEASAIGALAQQHELPLVYEAALQTEIRLSHDPLEKIQLSYTLASSLEARKQIPEASRILESTYRANPRILGVVRATTDFYTRTNQPRAAIATLLEAAKAATPQLSRSFTLEAAQKANDAGDATQARQLAMSLLPATPYDAQVLGIIAASYARAHDDPGLRNFYEAQLQAVRSATLSTEERRQDTALLRRGLIPALTRLKDFEGATSQYIALLSAYPEDSATAQEAALYALRYDRRAQLLAFLDATVQQSPNDSRFAILLAQVDTTFEDLPGALAAYSKAIAVRKDRADLYQARVELELRLGSSPQADAGLLEAAAADFNRLYLLSYKDPAWMVRLGELRARQQRPADAVAALETAYIRGRPASASNDFHVARQLAEWNLLAEARPFAEKGVALAGNDLLVPRDQVLSTEGGAATYARVLSRLGKADEALAKLAAARSAVDTSTTYPADLAQQLEDQGIDAADQAAQRKQYLAQRRQTADAQLQQAISALGAVVQAYFTPEQKLAFAQTLDRMHAAPALATGVQRVDSMLALNAAAASGLADREAEWRKQLLIKAPLGLAAAQREPYVVLQQHRLQFAELAATLEAYAARQKPAAAAVTLQQAAQAWRANGDSTDELRVIRMLALRNDVSVRDRFFDLLLRHDRAALATLAAAKNDDTLADAALNYAVVHTDQANALAAVAARGASLPAVWRPAGASLVRTFFADARTPAVPDDFTAALHPEATIATRLTQPADPARQLTGDQWFYYASRYGIYLATAARTSATPDPEDLLPAELEDAPTAAPGYLHLAQTYVEVHDLPSATREFNHALELAPNDLAARDAFALALYPTRRDQALAQWRAALLTLQHMQQRNNFPDTFFSGFEAVLRHLGERKVAAQFRPEIESILRPYFARNGNYRSNELLQAAYSSAATPAEGTALILSLSSAAASPDLLLEDLRSAPWLDDSSREPILLRRIELAKAGNADDPNRTGTILHLQLQLIDLYLQRNQSAQAGAVLSSIVSSPRQPVQGQSSQDESSSLATTRIVVAVRSGGLAALLTQWQSDPESAPSQPQLDNALRRLQRPSGSYKPDPAAIRPLAEFSFERKQLSNTLIATDFLALAQLRLQTGDLAAAVTLLNRLALRPAGSSTASDDLTSGASPATNANVESAAALLEGTRHPAEALPFLTTLSAGAPWDASFRLRLARAQYESNHQPAASQIFRAVAMDAFGRYSDRAAAAQALRGSGVSGSLGSAELTQLTSTRISPAAARQPYFVAARIFAAADPALALPDRRALLQEALAVAPEGSAAAKARLSLLQTGFDEGRAATFLAVFEQLRSTPSSTVTSDADTQENAPENEAQDSTSDADGDDIDTPEPAQPGVVTLSAATAGLSTEARIHLATQVAVAYHLDHQDGSAIAYYQLAIDLQNSSSGPAASSLLRQRDALQAGLDLARRNAQRAPLLHKDLAQPNQVRPRLTLAATPAMEAP